MKNKTYFTLLLITLTTILSGQISLIEYGSTWKYHDFGYEPEPQNTTFWAQNEYDDTAWPSGNGQLGYGDNDEETIVNDSAITAYFRYSFGLIDPAVFDSISMNLTYDDGAIIYLNGEELWRVNMPAGLIDYNTFSESQSVDNASAHKNFANYLVSGTNVIAVEVHQRSHSSTDLSFDFKMTGFNAGQVVVTRGPYLQKLSDAAITIRWRTDNTTNSIVHYGLVHDNLNMTATAQDATTEHEVSITNLNPDTKYYYALADTNGLVMPGSPDMYFKTAPLPGTTAPVRAWILGDCGTANESQRAVRDAYYNYTGDAHTDMVLFLGDNAYTTGTDNEYQTALFENMYETKLQNTVAWSSLGNHDGLSANSNQQTGPYYDIFSFPTYGESGGIASGTEAYYSFDYANIHFISLDSYGSDRSVQGSMYSWCLADIQNTTADWIVAFWHHPPYSKGSHDSDSEIQLIEMRENFLPMLEYFGVDLILSGHSHSYERSYLLNGHYDHSDNFDPILHTVGSSGSGDGKPNGNGSYVKTTNGSEAGKGTVYITTGSSGKTTSAPLNHKAMYYSVASLGSCILEVEGDQMEVKFIRETGAIEDYFIIQKSPECIVGDQCDDQSECTTGDVYDDECNCLGIFQDADDDGICDMLDQCPDFNDDLLGTACDDLDSCTVDDIFTPECHCIGTYLDTDEDGVCDALDVCPMLADDLIGTPCNDENGCTIEDVYTSECTCSGTFLDTDNDGICDAEDQCPDFDDHLIGSACDDLDACTVEDIITANCNCAGMYLDTDEDGVCDEFDICPMLPDSLIGTPCDDLLGCTVNDLYTENCACTGTFLDADEDGICDSEDQCPDQNDDLIGTPCDDQNPCTTEDIYNEHCACAGRLLDADEDGICDLEDDCPGLDNDLIGTPCDDGDPCTTEDFYRSNCGCIGAYHDSDNDGICDPLDLCNGLDDELIGTLCNDDDVCTVDDIYTENCTCAGRYIDEDGDGFCFAEDPDDNDSCIPDNASSQCNPCTEIIYDDFENGFGHWIDGGNDCARVSGNSRSGLYSVRIRDNSGPSSSLYTKNLDLAGHVSINLEFSFLTISMEQNEDFFLELSTNGGDTYSKIKEWKKGTDFVNNKRYFESIIIDNLNLSDQTRLRLRCDASSNNDQVYIDDIKVSSCRYACSPGLPCNDGSDCTRDDTYNSDCQCVGIFMDSDEDGVCDEVDICPGLNDQLIGTPCDDNDPCTTDDRYNESCDCAGVFMDTDEDGICDERDQCPELNDHLIGTSCDDDDPCTIDDTYNNDCHCAGVYQDSDDDGICDVEDRCPGIFDQLIGTPCDDGDACTTEDIYNSNCQCSGVYTDQDGDGFCIGADPDDRDACNPDPEDELCGTCPERDRQSFETELGIWNDGGSDCARVSAYPNHGTYSMRLRDNSGIRSSMYTERIDLSDAEELRFSFSFYAISMEQNEDFFLEISTDAGASFDKYREWDSGKDFLNNTRYEVSIVINDVLFSHSTVFRIRCDASNNNDQIYIDDVVLTYCSFTTGLIRNKETRKNSSIEVWDDHPGMVIYPNPASDLIKINISITDKAGGTFYIYNLQGKRMYYAFINTKEETIEINAENWNEGIYIASITTTENKSVQHKLVILK